MSNKYVVYEKEDVAEALNSLNNGNVTVVAESYYGSIVELSGKLTVTAEAREEQEWAYDDDGNAVKDEDDNQVYNKNVYSVWQVIGKDGFFVFPIHKISQIDKIRRRITIGF